MPGFDGVSDLLPNTGVPIQSGAYTPTYTNIGNTSGFVAGGAWYVRVGDIVFVSGAVTVTVTVSVLNEFYISTPVNSNFTAAGQASGVITQVVRNIAGQVISTAAQANKVRAQLQMGGSGGAPSFSFIFGYQVL